METLKTSNWWESNWYKEQEQIHKDFVKREGQNQHRLGRWVYYIDENNEVKFEYINI